ncbi:protein FAM83H-like isoform X2 [Xyrauchen texanus]|uniref:protein FAM83H-like isoform X2 n=1 Tax=Xyrauchen texanus TaxID=154827 RepID=UPI0022425ABE|nr:protein FAM83H-like isoform X2 [Xyrauchen texanus]
MAHRSQCSSVGDNPLDPNHLPPHYREEYRIAIDALIEADLEGYYGFLQGADVVDFLSHPEIEYIKCMVQAPHQQTVQPEKRYMAEDADGSSDTYWPIHSDHDAPSLDLGWPQQYRYVGPTEVTMLVNPCNPETASIKEEVRRLIKGAQQVVAVVMDMFTDVDIFADILGAAMRGVAVYILLDELNAHHFVAMVNNCRVNLDEIKFMRVRTVSGSTYFCQTGKSFKGQMMDRFILVDSRAVLSGNYSFMWSFEKIHRCLAHLFLGQLVTTFDEEFRILFAHSEPLVVENILANMPHYSSEQGSYYNTDKTHMLKREYPTMDMKWAEYSAEGHMNAGHKMLPYRRGEFIHTAVEENPSVQRQMNLHATQQFQGDHQPIEHRRQIRGPAEMTSFKRHGFADLPNYEYIPPQNHATIRGKQYKEGVVTQSTHFAREPCFYQHGTGLQTGYDMYGRIRGQGYHVDQFSGSGYSLEGDEAGPPDAYDHVQRYLQSHSPMEEGQSARNLMPPVQSNLRRHIMGKSYACQTSPTQQNLLDQKRVFNVNRKPQDVSQKQGLRNWRISSYLSTYDDAEEVDLSELEGSDLCNNVPCFMQEGPCDPVGAEIRPGNMECNRIPLSGENHTFLQIQNTSNLPDNSVNYPADLSRINMKTTPTTTSESSCNTEGDKVEEAQYREPKETNLIIEEFHRRKPTRTVPRRSRLRDSLIFKSNLEMNTSEMKDNSVEKDGDEKRRAPFQWSSFARSTTVENPFMKSAHSEEVLNKVGANSKEDMVENFQNVQKKTIKGPLQEKDLPEQVQSEVFEGRSQRDEWTSNVFQRSASNIDMNDPDCRLSFFKELAAKRKAELAAAKSSLSNTAKSPKKSDAPEKLSTSDIDKKAVPVFKTPTTPVKLKNATLTAPEKQKTLDGTKCEESSEDIPHRATDAEKIRLKKKLAEESGLNSFLEDTSPVPVMETSTVHKAKNQSTPILNVCTQKHVCDLSADPIAAKSVNSPKPTADSFKQQSAMGADFSQQPNATESDFSQPPTAIETGYFQQPTAIEENSSQHPTAAESESSQQPTVMKTDHTTIGNERPQHPTVADSGSSIDLPTMMVDSSQQPNATDTDSSHHSTATDIDSSQHPNATNTGSSKQPSDTEVDSSQHPTETDINSSQHPNATGTASSQHPNATDTSQLLAAKVTVSSQHPTATGNSSSQHPDPADTDSFQPPTANVTDPFQHPTATNTNSCQHTNATDKVSSQKPTATDIDSYQHASVTDTESSQHPTGTNTDASQQPTATDIDSSQHPSATDTDASQPTNAIDTSQQPTATDIDSSQHPSATKTDTSQQATATDTDFSQHPTATDISIFQQYSATHTDSTQQCTATGSESSQQLTATNTDSSQIPTATDIDSSQHHTATDTDASQHTNALDTSQQCSSTDINSTQPHTAIDTDSSQHPTATNTDSSQQPTAKYRDSSQHPNATGTDSFKHPSAKDIDSSQLPTATDIKPSQHPTAANTDTSQQATATDTDSSQHPTAANTDTSQQATATDTDSTQHATATDTKSSQQCTATGSESSQQLTATNTDTSQIPTATDIDSSQHPTATDTDASQHTNAIDTSQQPTATDIDSYPHATGTDSFKHPSAKDTDSSQRPTATYINPSQHPNATKKETSQQATATDTDFSQHPTATDTDFSQHPSATEISTSQQCSSTDTNSTQPHTAIDTDSSQHPSATDISTSQQCSATDTNSTQPHTASDTDSTQHPTAIDTESSQQCTALGSVSSQQLTATNTDSSQIPTATDIDSSQHPNATGDIFQTSSVCTSILETNLEKNLFTLVACTTQNAEVKSPEHCPADDSESPYKINLPIDITSSETCLSQETNSLNINEEKYISVCQALSKQGPIPSTNITQPDSSRSESAVITDLGSSAEHSRSDFLTPCASPESSLNLNSDITKSWMELNSSPNNTQAQAKSPITNVRKETISCQNDPKPENNKDECQNHKTIDEQPWRHDSSAEPEYHEKAAVSPTLDHIQGDRTKNTNPELENSVTNFAEVLEKSECDLVEHSDAENQSAVTEKPKSVIPTHQSSTANVLSSTNLRDDSKVILEQISAKNQSRASQSKQTLETKAGEVSSADKHSGRPWSSSVTQEDRANLLQKMEQLRKERRVYSRFEAS